MFLLCEFVLPSSLSSPDEVLVMTGNAPRNFLWLADTACNWIVVLGLEVRLMPLEGSKSSSSISSSNEFYHTRHSIPTYIVWGNRWKNLSTACVEYETYRNTTKVWFHIGIIKHWPKCTSVISRVIGDCGVRISEIFPQITLKLLHEVV